MRIARRALLAMLATAALACGNESAATAPSSPAPTSTPPLPPAAGWEVLPNSPVSPAQSRHEDVFFLSRTTGWLVNLRGEIHRTQDGGETWLLQHVDPTVLFRSVGFADERVGWAGNLNLTNTPEPLNALYETRDGGGTWTNITSRVAGREPVGICGIWVVDRATVYAAGRWNGPAVFVKSLDGGRSWRAFDLAPLATGLVDVYFFDRERGIVVGGRGVGSSEQEQRASQTVILGTQDGGVSWQVRHLSSAFGEWGWKISFPSRSVGYVATQGPAGSGVVLKTTDGGATWQELVVGAGLGFSGIGFATTQIGWVGGVDAHETRDGGATWRAVRLGEGLNRFRMAGDVGYAAGRQAYRFDPGALAQDR